MDAVNDSFLLESSIYRLLKKYCRGQPYYLHLLELFLQVGLAPLLPFSSCTLIAASQLPLGTSDLTRVCRSLSESCHMPAGRCKPHATWWQLLVPLDSL